MGGLYIGLMSGTSLDGVDGVLADFSVDTAPRWLSHTHIPFPDALQQQLLALHAPSHDELHRSQLAGLELSRLYARVVQQLMQNHDLQPNQISAIGAHGQTIRHRPVIDGEVGYTLQLNQPALLAELTGIRVVADFRSRDIAAGGQGAPLVPAFHQALWAQSDRAVAALNLGGIANLSLLQPDAALLGFDCGPGNMLLDAWHQRHRGGAYDDQGAWAASGQCQPALLAHLLGEPFFSAPPPKSTGRDLFHLGWLDSQLQAHPGVSAVDVQATLLELTAQSCAQALWRHMPQAQELVVCGGGAFNTALLRRLVHLLPECEVITSAAKGLHPSQVEAAAFAWLAQRAEQGLCANAPSVTGARGPRVLGAIYPA
ncbi:MAG: anhydro-N-acetylmuramic acid kinase [Alphaproteobacteria bacterium]|nr:anhydro-N-acetylmuramic acid kinase [Alphaproteobacteria bacterium]